MKNILTLLVIIIFLLGCTKVEPKSTAPPVESASESMQRNGPSVQDALITLLRSHPHAKQICFNSGQYAGYFIQYPALPTGKEDDNEFHGWYLIQTYKFLLAGNNTWFTNNADDKDYIVVFPDVTGLECKDQTP